MAVAQVIEIPVQNDPYYDIIEWKGKGGILMSKDPNGNSPQINLTLVGDDDQSIWDQKFTPMNEDFYYITSENARYVYFLNHLDLKSGYNSFSQLNSAGNINNTKVNIGAPIKKLGYDPSTIEMLNVLVTDDALVYMFREDDKKNKQYRELAVLVAHHNQKCFPLELGTVSYDLLKDEDNGHWQCIGFTGKNIYFAAREKRDKRVGWAVQEYSSLGKLLSSTYLEGPKDLLPIENIGFGTTGSYYMKNNPTMEKGLLAQINNKFYMMGGRRSSNSAELVLFEWNEGEWKEMNSMKLNYFLEKKPLSLGIYPMNEGIGYHLDHNGYDKVSMIYFEKGKVSPPHNDFTDKTVYNPSSVFIKKEKNEFVVKLDNGKGLKFDINQLGSKEAMKFEIVE